MLDGVTAVVTGASQGLGREIALAMGEAGANVALCARSDGIYETAEMMDDAGQSLPVETDVTDEDAVRAAIERTVETFGRLDCLVNNAGVAGPTAPIEEVARRDWEHTLDVNVTGVYLMTKHAVPTLRESDQASIVNIASISGKVPLVYRTSYTTSKMAVVGLSRTLAFELGDDQITVNAVCPGSVDSPRMDRVIERKARELNESEAAVREDITEDAALGRMVEPDDVADIVVYLASEKGRHITGQDINVDAGTIWD